MTQKYLLTFSTSNLKLKFLGVIAICLFTLFAITSCGGAKDRKKELDITNAQVEGDNKDIVSIVDGKYTLVGTIKGEMGQQLYIQLKIRLNHPIKGDALHINFSNVNIGIEIIDKNDVALLNYKLPFQDITEFKKFLTEGKEGDVKDFNFAFLMINKEQYAKLMDDAVSVRLVGMSIEDNDYVDFKNGGKIKNNEETNIDNEVTENEDKADNDENEDLSEASTGDENFDEWLNEYEEYCNSYIALLKKASKGDMSAIAEYTKMLQKAQGMSKKIDKVEGDLTPAQLAKFQRIQTKLMKAAQNL